MLYHELLHLYCSLIDCAPKNCKQIEHNSEIKSKKIYKLTFEKFRDKSVKFSREHWTINIFSFESKADVRKAMKPEMAGAFLIAKINGISGLFLVVRLRESEAFIPIRVTVR